MSFTHSYSPLEPGQKLVKIKFTNQDGMEFTKTVNIPYHSDGTLNELYFNEIIEGQIRSIAYKMSISSIEFGEPEPENTYVPPEV